MSGIRASPVGLKDADDDYSFYLLKTDVERLAKRFGTETTRYLTVDGNLSDLENAEDARDNLGLGTIATQNASAVDITGGTIDSVTQTNSSLYSCLIDGADIHNSATSGSFTFGSLLNYFPSGTAGRLTQVYQDPTSFRLMSYNANVLTASLQAENSTGKVEITCGDYFRCIPSSVGGYAEISGWLMYEAGSISQLNPLHSNNWVVGNSASIGVQRASTYLKVESPDILKLVAGTAATTDVATTLTETIGGAWAATMLGGSQSSNGSYTWEAHGTSQVALFNSYGGGSASRLAYNTSTYLQVATGGITTAACPAIALTSTTTTIGLTANTDINFTTGGTNWMTINSTGGILLKNSPVMALQSGAFQLYTSQALEFQAGDSASSDNVVTHKIKVVGPSGFLYILATTSSA